jgi:hypothetical protein
VQYGVVAVEGLGGLLCIKRESREELASTYERRERKIEIKRHVQNIDRIENERIKKVPFLLCCEALSALNKNSGYFSIHIMPN